MATHQYVAPSCSLVTKQRRCKTTASLRTHGICFGHPPIRSSKLASDPTVSNLSWTPKTPESLVEFVLDTQKEPEASVKCVLQNQSSPNTSMAGWYFCARIFCEGVPPGCVCVYGSACIGRGKCVGGGVHWGGGGKGAQHLNLKMITMALTIFKGSILDTGKRAAGIMQLEDRGEKWLHHPCRIGITHCGLLSCSGVCCFVFVCMGPSSWSAAAAVGGAGFVLRCCPYRGWTVTHSSLHEGSRGIVAHWAMGLVHFGLFACEWGPIVGLLESCPPARMY